MSGELADILEAVANVGETISRSISTPPAAKPAEARERMRDALLTQMFGFRDHHPGTYYSDTFKLLDRLVDAALGATKPTPTRDADAPEVRDLRAGIEQILHLSRASGGNRLYYLGEIEKLAMRLLASGSAQS